MKRKSPVAAPAPEVEPAVIVSPEILDEAMRLVESDKPKAMAKCVVCGNEANPNPVEQLCWVCRRLKISAWRDVENQAPVQE